MSFGLRPSKAKWPLILLLSYGLFLFVVSLRYYIWASAEEEHQDYSDRLETQGYYPEAFDALPTLAERQLAKYLFLKQTSTDSLFFRRKPHRRKATHYITPSFDVVITNLTSAEELKWTLKSIAWQDENEAVSVYAIYRSEEERERALSLRFLFASRRQPFEYVVLPAPATPFQPFLHYKHLNGNHVWNLRAGDVLLPHSLKSTRLLFERMPWVQVLTYDYLLVHDQNNNYNNYNYNNNYYNKKRKLKSELISFQSLKEFAFWLGDGLSVGTHLIVREKWMQQMHDSLLMNATGIHYRFLQFEHFHYDVPMLMREALKNPPVLSPLEALLHNYTERTLSQLLMMKQQPLVSVIVPFYNNPEKWLEEMLRSLELQTFRDFEVIFIDDGSNPASSWVLRRQVGESCLDRVRLHSHSKNCGLSCARNTGALLARSEFLLFLDPDDLLAPSALEKLSLKLLLHPELDFTFPGSVHFGKYQLHNLDDFDADRLLQGNYLPSCAMLRRQTYLQIGGMDEEFEGFEDYDFWLRLIGFGGRGSVVAEPLFYYRRHDEGMTSKIVRHNDGQWMQELALRNPAAYGRKPMGFRPRFPWYQPLSWRRPSPMVVEVERLKKERGDVSSEAYELSRQTFGSPFVFVSPLNANHHVQAIQSRRRRINVLYFIPFMVVGGSERVDIDILTGLRDDFRRTHSTDSYSFHVTLVVASDSRGHPWQSQFEPVVDDMLFLERQCPPSPSSGCCIDQLLDYMLVSRNVDLVFTRNEGHGYALIQKWKQKCPQLATADLVHLYAASGDAWDALSKVYHRFLTKRFVISRQLQVYMHTTHHLPVEDFTVIYNGLNTSRFDRQRLQQQQQSTTTGTKTGTKISLRQQLKLGADIPIVGYVGRVDPEKRPWLWMEIAAEVKRRLTHVHFVFMGDGSSLASTRTQAIALGFTESQLTFLGHQERVETFLLDYSVLLMTSVHEGLPFTVLEALSLGVPVVSTDVGAVREVIEDGRNGFVLADRLPKEVFAQKVVEAIALGAREEQRQAMAAAIRQRFDVERTRERYRRYFVEMFEQVNQEEKLWCWTTSVLQAIGRSMLKQSDDQQKERYSKKDQEKEKEKGQEGDQEEIKEEEKEKPQLCLSV